MREPGDAEEAEEEGEDVVAKPQPISQLITAFSRAATTTPVDILQSDSLFIEYSAIMSQVHVSLEKLPLAVVTSCVGGFRVVTWRTRTRRREVMKEEPLPCLSRNRKWRSRSCCSNKRESQTEALPRWYSCTSVHAKVRFKCKCTVNALLQFMMLVGLAAGEWSDMVIGTLDLGISILAGGNVDIQKVTNTSFVHDCQSVQSL